MSDDNTTPTWGPYPGDKLVPPPTPQAPEIPMSTTWPWVAGAFVALKFAVALAVLVIVAVAILGFAVGWW